MLKGVEDVCVIDSFVIDKANFLKAYKISEESGKLFTYNDYFKTKGYHPNSLRSRNRKPYLLQRAGRRESEYSV